ncbi:GH32 C-terminal domain-containing protein [Microbacterium sp. KNMS]
MIRVPRPAFHLTPRRNWMNDPNGLVHHSGLWHAYFQYNPESSDWGNMSWGHASSTDLAHWTEHPVALRHRPGEQIFSGSVVAERDGGRLIAHYTSAYDDGRQAQSRAVSDDGGLTWSPDLENPVLDRGTTSFRDPKVVRFPTADGRDRWILVAVEADARQVLFYGSDDLRTWEHLSSFGPLGTDGVVWECPDLVPLAVDDDPDDIRWVLLLSTNPVGDDADPRGSAMSWIAGTFDGIAFTPDTCQFARLDEGRDLYAGVTFDSAPGGEAVMLAWMSNWRYAHAIPSSPWRGAMSLARRLSLRRDRRGRVRLHQEPPIFVREHLADTPSKVVLAARPFAELALTGHSLLELEWDPRTTGSLRLRLTGDADAFAELSHDPETATLRFERGGPDAEAVHPDFASACTTGLIEDGSTRRLLISLDGPLLEVFADDGAATITHLVMLGDGPVVASLQTERAGAVRASAAHLAADRPTETLAAALA